MLKLVEAKLLPNSVSSVITQDWRSLTINKSVAAFASLGLAMRRHRTMIIALQWVVVVFYLLLVITPALIPLPSEQAHIFNHLTRFAQFAFWAIWWPFVILSMMIMGRAWCGVLCPEGALTEWVSKWGLGYGIPRWMKWGGMPFFAFVATTLFGQMTSVYEYPKPALLILGGSTLAAMVVGLLYGREKRVWCRHLCPVSGVFGLLAKVAPVHFHVDRAAWDAAPVGTRASREHQVNCAPLIDIRRMESASACHMCGRCANERGAVQLALRSPNAEILSIPTLETKKEVENARELDAWSIRLLMFGMLGVALGAFQWTSSPWFVAIKQAAATFLIEHGIVWPLNAVGHWWLFTFYPEVNDVFSWLDGMMLLGYIGVEALIIGSWIWLWMRLGTYFSGLSWSRLCYVLIPFAGVSVFVGLSLITTSQLAAEGIALPWAIHVRSVLLGLAAIWSVWLAQRLIKDASLAQRAVLSLITATAVALPYAAWLVQFYVW